MVLVAWKAFWTSTKSPDRKSATQGCMNSVHEGSQGYNLDSKSSNLAIGMCVLRQLSTVSVRTPLLINYQNVLRRLRLIRWGWGWIRGTV
jgi:hypothetical protein